MKGLLWAWWISVVTALTYLNKDNVDPFLQHNDYTLILFYAPCKISGVQDLIYQGVGIRRSF